MPLKTIFWPKTFNSHCTKTNESICTLDEKLFSKLNSKKELCNNPVGFILKYKVSFDSSTLVFFKHQHRVASGRTRIIILFSKIVKIQMPLETLKSSFRD